jgi:hypothetical protein
MRVRATQDFTRTEAIGPRNAVVADPADPLWLHVRTTDDTGAEVESAMLPNTPTYGNVVTQLSKYPYKLFTGTWAYELTPQLYLPNKQYTIHWRYALIPQVMAVVRNNFTWQALPQMPREVDGCVLYGCLSRVGGSPITNARVVIEQYKDFVTLNHRLGSVEVSTDAFGNWWLEVPRNSIQRVIFGETIRTVKIPEVERIALKDCKDYQPDVDGRKDSFGYPMP